MGIASNNYTLKFAVFHTLFNLVGVALMLPLINTLVAVLEKALSRYDGERATLPVWAVKAHYLLGQAYEKSGWTKKAIEKYEDFVRKGIEDGNRPELVGGGLIRSLGGWSQVLSLRRVGSKVFSDERILGSSEFVKNVISEAEEKAKETLRLTLKISDLPSLAIQVCEEEGVDAAALRSGLRKRDVVKSRRIFCQIVVRKIGYSVRLLCAFLV